jgi:hypothetical protein
VKARDRARLAADIIAGRVVIDASTLTIGQIAQLCRVSMKYVNEARDPDRVKRIQQKKLAAIFDAIGPDARAEVCRTVGVERAWNALIGVL